MAEAIISGTNPTVPPTFIIKVASGCNLNCKYCYMYNLEDQESWKKQPAFISDEVISTSARKIRQHLERQGFNSGLVVFHGGEPLLAGAARLRRWSDLIAEEFEGSKVTITLGIQTNGTLFSPEIGDVLLRRNISVGVSIDGVPGKHDFLRVDHRGNPSGSILHEKLKILTSDKYKPIFSGFLTVINIANDPIEIIDYLMQFDPPGFDFLLPLDNYDRRPYGKEDLLATPYADWLIRAFDYLVAKQSSVEVRAFRETIRRLVYPGITGGLFGDNPRVIIIESDGSIEMADTLRASFPDLRLLDKSILFSDISDIEGMVAEKARVIGEDDLSDECRACPLVGVCGGGGFQFRYSSENGFRNPSVYCEDMKKFISHIYETLISAAS